MKNKIIVLFIILLSISACSSNKQTAVAKLDDTKDYIYTETGDDLDLNELLSAQDRKEDYTLISSKLTSKYLGLPVEKDLLEFNRIKLNIDSEDAKKLQITQTASEDFTASLREKNEKVIQSGEYVFAWSGANLYDSYITDDAISFITISNSFMYPGHVNFEMKAYALDKTSGEQLDHKAQLAKLNLNEEKIIERVKKDFENNPIEINGEMVQRRLNETIDGTLDTHDSFYILPATNSIVVDNDQIILILHGYSALDGEFSIPSLYTLKIEPIK